MECMERSTDLHPNLSPLLFSDEEIDEEDDSTNLEESSTSEDNSIHNVIKSRDERLVSQIRLVMTGVPPPPSFITPKLDTSEVLRLWNENQHLIKDLVENYADSKSAAILVEEEAKNTPWPQVMDVECLGVHYNRSNASEELERLCSKYRERFVGRETSSWINLLCLSPVRTASAKKRARYRGWGHSPGRRLSHLARRRRAFTSANLQSVSGNNSGMTRERKMILVELKKPNQQQKPKSRNSSTKKQQAAKMKNSFKVSGNPKRALFQSPDDKPGKTIKPISARVKQSPNQLKIQRSKRALWPDDQSAQKKEFNSNGKRGRNSLTPSPRKKCNRNLFCDGSVSRHKGSLHLGQQNSLLSNPHQKKLLWAISQALRDEGIRMNHQIFQSCLSVLNGPCMALWIWKTSKEAPRGSTSENMLALVKQFTIENVIQQVQENSSTSNLVSLRLGLMKKVEAIKSGESVKINGSGNIVDTAVESNEIRMNKENISKIVSLTLESNQAVKKSPLKDINLKCKTPAKLTSEDSNRSNKKTNLTSGNSETKSSQSSDETFNGFNIDSNDVKSMMKQTAIPETEETKVSFSEFLSWNADPISRFQIKAPDFNPYAFIVNNDTKFLNCDVTNNSNVLFGDQKQTLENTNEENFIIEFPNDDETRSSSIYSFDLNNFVEESRTCFEFPNVHNLPCTNVCRLEET